MVQRFIFYVDLKPTFANAMVFGFITEVKREPGEIPGLSRSCKLYYHFFSHHHCIAKAKWEGRKNEE